MTARFADPREHAGHVFRETMDPILLLAEQYPDATEVCIDGATVKLDLGNEWQRYRLGDFVMSLRDIEAAARAAAVFAGLEFGPQQPAMPVMSVKMPPDLRVSIVCPPVAEHWHMSIRFLRSRALTLEDYVAAEIMMPIQANMLTEMVEQRKNLVISGATSSGKTTLLRALLEMVAHERLIIIEDTPELSVRPTIADGQDILHWSTTSGVDMAALLRQAMRMRPDRIVVGEVRGPEALELVRATNTGHEGVLSTLHSNGGEDTLRRLHTLVLEGQPHFPPDMIRTAVDYDVHLTGRGEKRRLEKIWKVAGAAVLGLVLAAPVRAETITLQPGHYDALHINGQSNVTYRCAIAGACSMGSGTKIEHSSGVTLDGFRFDGGMIGVNIAGSDNVTVTHSTFVSQGSAGVSVNPGMVSHNVHIVDNSFQNNRTGCNYLNPSNCSGHLGDGSPVAFMDYGVRVYDADGVVISGNQFGSLFNHAISFKWGVDNSQILDNTFNGCGRVCIQLAQDGNMGSVFIDGNTMTGHAMHAISTIHNADVHLGSNTIDINGNGGDGGGGGGEGGGVEQPPPIVHLPDPPIETPEERRRRIMAGAPPVHSCCDNLTPESLARAMQRPWN
jgi:type IV secretory pathway ATPase VirB11/archaellum biosynthesis ATPase